MTELTKLDICKKIAEIEGLSFEVRIGSVFLLPWSRYGAEHQYNPLNNKALLWDLCDKHFVSIDREQCVVSITNLLSEFTGVGFLVNSGIPRAVLECIIECN